MSLRVLNLEQIITILSFSYAHSICGLVVRVPGNRSRGPGSIPRATRPLCLPRSNFYPRKLALTWLRRGGRSVGIVRSQTKSIPNILLDKN
jgi:hypothetical protein